jgi:hypothetical protein
MSVTLDNLLIPRDTGSESSDRKAFLQIMRRLLAESLQSGSLTHEEAIVCMRGLDEVESGSDFKY